MVVSFADLKKYRFHYWFAFPAIHSHPPWVPVSKGSSGFNETSDDPIIPGSQRLTGQESSALVDAVQTWRYGVDSRQRGFFLARRNWKDRSELDTGRPKQGGLPETDLTRPTHSDAIGLSWKISSLASYEAGFFNGAHFEDCYVCFADPSNYSNAPGWMLRNLLVLVRQRWGLDKVQILCYRDVQSKRDQGRSLVITLKLDSSRASDHDILGSSKGQMPKVTGWERNSAGKLVGRVADLTAYMDPYK
jgi:ubiquitin-like modifier-activating enzyme ATG7